MKRLLVLVAALALLLPGCTVGPAPLRVELILRPGDMQYWRLLEQGATTAAREFALELNVVVAGGEEQYRAVEEAVAAKVDAIVLAPEGYDSLAAACEDAAGAGIPVVSVDSGINSEHLSAQVGSNNSQAAQMLGSRIVEWSGGKGRIAVISFSRTCSSATERERELRGYLEENSGIQWAQPVYSLSNQQFAYSQTRQLLEQDPDINILVGLDSSCVQGAAQAVAELDRQVLLFGFDCSLEQAQLLEDGVLLATAVQSPYAMGYLGVKNAWDLLQGQQVPQRFNTPVIIVTKDNMFSSMNQKMVFPFVEP